MCWNCSKMMKSYIWVQTADGSIQQVEQAVAMFCPFICHEVHMGKGTSKNHAISLPEKVNPAMLSLILDYCRFHQEPGHSNKERKSFDERFMRMDTRRLCELASAADSLQFKPLVELTSRALARMIEGKTPEEIREIFCLPDDLTEEEKLEPVRNLPGDPRIRLLNRLYAKRRKELRERNKMKLKMKKYLKMIAQLMIFCHLLTATAMVLMLLRAQIPRARRRASGEKKNKRMFLQFLRKGITRTWTITTLKIVTTFSLVLVKDRNHNIQTMLLLLRIVMILMMMKLILR